MGGFPLWNPVVAICHLIACRSAPVGPRFPEELTMPESAPTLEEDILGSVPAIQDLVAEAL